MKSFFFAAHKINFNCELCNFHCNSKNELETHISSEHSSHSRYFCDICQFASFQKLKLNQHKKKYHRFQCSQCKRVFENVREKNQHEKDHRKMAGK